MSSALIGYTGYVGSTLLRQTEFSALYRSTNIGDMRGNSFDTVVCAGAPAQKWIANRDPSLDRQKIDNLIDILKTIKCKTFILVSTVDVFQRPIGVDEHSVVNEIGLHAYGLNRRELEKFVERHFKNYLIIRLPGLVGPGLRKNVIFDFHNQNNLQMIESRSVFQFYPMVNLWFDIKLALSAGIRLIHLTANPISVAEVAEQGFGKHFNQKLSSTPILYDMRSQYADIYNKQNCYQYSVKETIQAIRTYAQTEPTSILMRN